MASWKTKNRTEYAQQNQLLTREQQFTERMWNQTNDWNLAQWNRENEYNSPVSQMARFAEAGINPNNAAAAIAGHDSAAGSAMASAPSSPSAPSAPDPSGTDFAANLSAGVGLVDQILGLGRYVDTERDIQKRTADKLDAEVRNTNAATENAYVENDVLKEQLSGLKFENVFLKPEQLDQVRETNKQIQENTRLTKYQADGVLEANNNLIKQGQLLDDEHKKNESLIKQAEEQVKYWQEQTKLAVSQQEQSAAQAGLAKAQQGLAAVQAEGQKISNAQEEIVRKYNQELFDLGIDPNGTGNATTEGAKTAAVNASRAAKNGKNAPNKDKSNYNKYNPNPFKHGRARSNNHRNMTDWSNMRNNSDYGVLE